MRRRARVGVREASRSGRTADGLGAVSHGQHERRTLPLPSTSRGRRRRSAETRRIMGANAAHRKRPLMAANSVQASTASHLWWEQAACAGHDPDWWSDNIRMRHRAVEICLACPVRQACLTEARRTRDLGVVRGGMLFVRERNGSVTISMVCAHCHVRPVHITPTGHGTYCGSYCATQHGRSTPTVRQA